MRDLKPIRGGGDRTQRWLRLRVGLLGAVCLLLLVGVFVLMVALVDWSAVEAEVKDLFRFRFTRDSVALERAAEIRILSLVETGGNGSDVDFRAEVVNEGTRFARVDVRAEVDGQGVRCEPAQLDLLPNQPPVRTRILVPRC